MTSSRINTQAPLLPRSASLSAVLHVGVLALLVFATWWSRRVHDDPPPPFELVAGPGDNYAALEAPQPVAQKEVEFNVPDIPKPVARPEPPKPKPVEIKPQPKPTPVKVEPAPEKPPIKIEKAPEPKKVEPAPERVSFDDFVAQNGAPKAKPVTTKAPKPIKTKAIDVSGVLEVTRVTAGAGGTAMSRQEVDMTRAYVQMIIDRVKESMERAGITESREASVEFTVTLRGAIESPELVRSSGSSAFDRAVLAAFKSIRPVGKPPTGRAERFRANVNMSEG